MFTTRLEILQCSSLSWINWPFTRKFFDKIKRNSTFLNNTTNEILNPIFIQYSWEIRI